MAAALAGIRVLDCTHVIAGAYCSMTLADLGADVVKIEPPGGETTRGRPGAPFSAFDFMNRNKRTIAVDLASAAGAEAVRRLARTADIFVENYRPGALDRMGLGYAQLSQINPGLIYCSISGFGLDGPYRERGGFDLVAQAMSGIMSFTGPVDGDRPTAAGVPLSDLNSGVFGAIAVLAALNHRHATGEGQHVEASLLESAMAYTAWETGLYLTMGEVATPRGSRHRLAAPYQAFRTADGFMVVGVNNQGLWLRFIEALGRPDLQQDERFDNNTRRVRNADALQAVLEEILAADTTAGWIERLAAKGVPAGPVNSIAQAWADPQIQARGLLAEVEGRRFVRAPIKMSRTPVAVRTGPAAVGAHTRQVLAEAGYSADEIDELVASGAVVEAGEGKGA